MLAMQQLSVEIRGCGYVAWSELRGLWRASNIQGALSYHQSLHAACDYLKGL